METDSGKERHGGYSVVVIDDEESMREGCRQTLEAEGISAAAAGNGEDGLRMVQEFKPDVVVVDLKMPGMNGLDVVARVSQVDSSILSIIITGYGTIDTAVESMKSGAFDFINKPFDPERLVDAVRKGLNLRELHRSDVAHVPVAPRVKPALGMRQDVLLKGLDFLSEAYAGGYARNEVMEELHYLEREARHNAEKSGEVVDRESMIEALTADFRMVDDIIDRHGYKKSQLLQILLDVQEQKNWLPRHVLRWASARLQVPYGEILTMVRFYEAFNLQPQGTHTIQVCTGTACHVRGAPQLIARISSLLGIQPGETDRHQRYTLKTVHCMGCCALAPVMKVDDDYYTNPDLETLKRILAVQEKEDATWQN
ncbi:NAD(P)H-dependent oxidoreductase subunit E [bacterium]|nr:NAD(P)H-dependent oxidoreductase subunit E [candidate division CSSED10-310 bacterium]